MSYGKDQERIKQERSAVQREEARREDTAALSGMSLGILIALAIAACVGAFFYLSRRDETVPTAAPVLSPSSAPASSAPEKETIIREEKTRELVPVPQATAQPPNINITVPSAVPSAPASSGSNPVTEGNPKPSAQAEPPSASAEPTASATTAPKP